MCTQRTLVERWEALKSHIGNYPYWPVKADEGFEILISSRHSGVPTFHSIDSEKAGFFHLLGDLHTLGDGKIPLDELTAGLTADLMAEHGLADIIQFHRAHGQMLTHKDAPYILAFSIYKKVWGPTREDLEDRGVGGYVHFIAQDAEGEWRQKPCVYLMAHIGPTKDNSAFVCQRIAFDRDELFKDVIVLTYFGPGLNASWSFLVQNPGGGAKTWDQDRGRRIVEKQIAEPLYHILLADVIREDGIQDGVTFDLWHGAPQVTLKGEIVESLFKTLRTMHKNVRARSPKNNGWVFVPYDD